MIMSKIISYPHYPNISKLSARLIFVIISILFLSDPLYSQSLREKENLSYIVELFNSSEGYLDETAKEIELFRATYPDSPYLLYLDYFSANIALRKGDYKKSSLLYNKLINQYLPPDILNDIYLNYAICCYYLDDYKTGIQLLNTLEKSAINPWYITQANLWRGRSYARQELWLSAEQELSKALASGEKSALYDYFQTLVALKRDSTVKALLDSLSTELPESIDYFGTWLEHLLNSGRYEEFDTYLARLGPYTSASIQIGLLQVRQALNQEDYAQASSLLDSLNVQNDLARYYRAIVLINTGNTSAADSLFQILTNSSDHHLACLSYLERLKILAQKDKNLAFQQLQKFIKEKQPQYGEAYQLLGKWYMERENYRDAIHNLLAAFNFPLEPHSREQNYLFAAETWFYLKNYKSCVEICKNYLRKYPSGRYCDSALYYLAESSLFEDNTENAKQYYTELIQQYPESKWEDLARFKLAEIYFQASDYKTAEEIYKNITPSPENYSALFLRLAQTYYHQDKYDEAKKILLEVLEPTKDFESAILLASIHFNQKEYDQALNLYNQAESIASNKVQKDEARAYCAYTLFYLKRFNEATNLFLELAQDSLNTEIFLLQAAKSAVQGKNWNKALQLYDRFLDEYPESDYYLQAMSDLANVYYNLGDYNEALDYWLGVLRNFTSNTYFSESELAFLSDVFTGIELSARKLQDPERITEISEMIDLFPSEYIKFELEYILVKLYADEELWNELITEAAKFKSSLNLPQKQHNEIDLLMLKALINLNRLAEADSLAQQLYETYPSQEVLIKWAELAELNGNPLLALERYREAFALKPEANIWLKMLELSYQNDYQDFMEIWNAGASFCNDNPHAQIMHLQFLWEKVSPEETFALADSLLQTQTDPFLRAICEFYQGRTYYQKEDYSSALISFRKIRQLYRDYNELYRDASYFYILSLINLAEFQEAELYLKELQDILLKEQIEHIQQLLSYQPQ
ncbi:MAG: tetratricopeptide repeat protein [Candidatus Cloacimonadaceae bacterium]|jgi:tetratricopeptide (TPR) repeat protein